MITSPIDSKLHTFIQGLRDNQQGLISSLFLSGNSIGDSGVALLSPALQSNTTLGRLELSYQGISPAGVEHLARGLRGNHTLIRLSLRGNKIGDIGAASLAAALTEGASLEDLDLSNTGITNAGVRSLTEAVRVNRTLVSVILKENYVDNAETKELFEALELNKIRDLHSFIMQGNEEAVKKFISEKGESRAAIVNQNGDSSLHLAAFHGRAGIAAYIIACSVDKWQRNHQNETAMDIAKKHNSLSLAILLSTTGVHLLRQYRSFDHLYLFKIRETGGFLLKIMDIQQKQVLFKREFLPSELAALNIQGLPTDHFLPTLLQLFYSAKLIPVEFLLKDQCLSEVKSAIEEFRSRTLDEIHDYESPISLEIFTNPVSDGLGHTFEMGQVQVGQACPLGGERIGSLTSNFDMRRKIAGILSWEPIPNFSLFKKENFEIVEAQMRIANLHIQGKEYAQALQAYTDAFAHTKRWSDYAVLPPLFVLMGEAGKATLAYLYLVQYQLEDGKITEAIETLKQCQQYITNDPVISQHPVVAVVYCLLTACQSITSSDSTDWLQAARQTVIRLMESSYKPQAITLYKQMLTKAPNEFDLYLRLASLSDDPHEKRHLLLKGMCQAIDIVRADDVRDLCEAVGQGASDSYYDQLVLLSQRICEGNVLSIDEIEELSNTFERKGLVKEALQSRKLLSQLAAKEYLADSNHEEKITNLYEVLKPQKAMMRSIASLSSSIEKADWTKSEKISPYLFSQEILRQCSPDQLAEAERTLRIAYDHFKHPNSAISLAEILHQQGKIPESVQMYYQGCWQSYLTRVDKMDLCMQRIKQMDPTMQHLSEEQRQVIKVQQEDHDTVNLLLQQIHELESELQRLRSSR